MECSCSASNIDGEGNYSCRYITAAKDTVCPECNNKISKGEKYLFSTLFLDGNIHNSKMCLMCESVTDQFFPDGYYIGRIWDDLDSYIDNSWPEDIPSNCISKLHPSAKKIVCDIFNKYQE